MDRRRIMDENGRRDRTAVQNGSLLRLSESRQIAIYRRDDALARLSNEFSCRSGALSPSTQRS
jgi:hypothetical protein